MVCIAIYFRQPSEHIESEVQSIDSTYLDMHINT